MFSISVAGGLAGGGEGTPGGGGGPAAQGHDPFWEYVVFYSRMDDDPPTDLSISGKTVTDGGAGATLDTTNFRFGSASRDYDGSSTGYDELADSNDWDFGAGDFTVEGWFRWTTDSANIHLVGRWDSGTDRGWQLFYDSTNNHLEWFYSTTGADAVNPITATFTPVTGRWYHIACSRSKGIVRMFVNGEILQAAADAATYSNSDLVLRIAARSSDAAAPFDGKVDEIRITKGVDRYA